MENRKSGFLSNGGGTTGDLSNSQRSIGPCRTAGVRQEVLSNHGCSTGPTTRCRTACRTRGLRQVSSPPLSNNGHSTGPFISPAPAQLPLNQLREDPIAIVAIAVAVRARGSEGWVWAAGDKARAAPAGREVKATASSSNIDV